MNARCEMPREGIPYLSGLWSKVCSRQNAIQIHVYLTYIFAPSVFNFWSVVIFTALHEMQTRSSDENSVCLSVRLFVCLSVTRVIPDVTKMEERSVQIYILYERTFSLVFWEEEWMVGGGDPFYLKFWVNRPPLERNRRFSTDHITVVEDRPILSVKYCLPVPVFYFWGKL